MLSNVYIVGSCLLLGVTLIATGNVLLAGIGGGLLGLYHVAMWTKFKEHDNG